MKRRCLLLVFFSFLVAGTMAQNWVIPSESGTKLSSFSFSDSTRKTGSNLYNLNCKSCHGDPGKNNAVKLVPPPPDPTASQMQNNSDGALFFKVTEGRGTMPSFKNTLSLTDIWNVISYIRGFNDKYVQELAKKAVPGQLLEQVKMIVSWYPAKSQVAVVVTSVKDQNRQPVVGAELKLFAGRYFGNLPVGEAHSTDMQGIALFDFPKNLPGDSSGLVRLLVKPTDEAAFGEAKGDTTLRIGVPTYRPPLNEPRALWNVVQKTPVWLLLTYILSVLAVWGFIVYVMLLLRLIYKSGTDLEK